MQPKEAEQIAGSPVSVGELPDDPTVGQSARGPSALTWLTVAIAILAFGWRLWSVLRGGGLNAIQGYDDGVYYTGADALVSGRMPYRDFVLLHPPGILLVLAPFAALGHLLSDPTGFALAR
ncbi:MAG: hypothetical protein QOF35_1586, partial [Actinomycetota bacterium]|nr:hypothetical protein [Actinomycetota bacterium]